MASDHYQILNVGENATADEIRAAHLRLARQHHPDLNFQEPSSEERFKRIQLAYEILRDFRSRAKYDRDRRALDTRATAQHTERPCPPPEASSTADSPQAWRPRSYASVNFDMLRRATTTRSESDRLVPASAVCVCVAVVMLAAMAGHQLRLAHLNTPSTIVGLAAADRVAPHVADEVAQELLQEPEPGQEGTSSHDVDDSAPQKDPETARPVRLRSSRHDEFSRSHTQNYGIPVEVLNEIQADTKSIDQLRIFSESLHELPDLTSVLPPSWDNIDRLSAKDVDDFPHFLAGTSEFELPSLPVLESASELLAESPLPSAPYGEDATWSDLPLNPIEEGLSPPDIVAAGPNSRRDMASFSGHSAAVGGEGLFSMSFDRTIAAARSAGDIRQVDSFYPTRTTETWHRFDGSSSGLSNVSPETSRQHTDTPLVHAPALVHAPVQWPLSVERQNSINIRRDLPLLPALSHGEAGYAFGVGPMSTVKSLASQNASHQPTSLIDDAGKSPVVNHHVGRSRPPYMAHLVPAAEVHTQPTKSFIQSRVPRLGIETGLSTIHQLPHVQGYSPAIPYPGRGSGSTASSDPPLQPSTIW